MMSTNEFDNSDTFTIFENGSIGPTNQIDRSGFNKAGIVGFWLFVGIGFFIAIITPSFTAVQRLIVIGISIIPGLYFYFTMPENKWLEIDKPSKVLTIYRDKTKSKIIRNFGQGQYLIRPQKFVPVYGNRHYGICVFPIDDPKGHKFSYILMIFSSNVKEREADEYAREVNSQIDNYLNDRPFDKNLIQTLKPDGF
jgi:hypothetical protein